MLEGEGADRCRLLAGICRERPRVRKSALLGVLGLDWNPLSSFATWAVSRMFGEGARVPKLSEKDRVFMGVCKGVCSAGSGAGSIRMSIFVDTVWSDWGNDLKNGC